MRYAILGLAALSLTGCGIAQIQRAKTDYDASRRAYKECLATRQPSQCESQRQAMNADARAYAAEKGSMIGIEIGQ